ncbi:MAG TPA: glycosyltransferase family 4 protein [Acidimicrobiales bacterium]|nr:glycosyltransferase family 4 protein [Acidimicrobiales bacterium]
MVPGASGRAWPTDPTSERGGASPAVLFVVLAPGVGGSVRSLATGLEYLTGVRRVVARPSASSCARFLGTRGVVDASVDLPRSTGHRLFDRPRAVVVLSSAAWAYRRQLTAIHANGLAELSLSIIPGCIARCPVVVWVHEWQVSPWSRRLRPFLKFGASGLRFLAVSEQTRSMIVASGIGRPDQVCVVPNPIDPADVCPASRRQATSAFRVAYIGTPARYKGFHLLPDLIRALPHEPLTWTVFAGPETMMPDTFAELRNLGVGLPGKVLDVREAYGSCDAVVVPSLRESFGRVVAEAMANGLPVVGSDLEPIRDLLGEDRAGLLVPPGDVGGLATAIRRLVGDRELGMALGEEGRRRVKRFAPGPIADQLARAYGINPLRSSPSSSP